MTREEKIMKRMREHYEHALTLYEESRIVGLFLQGSQNYGLDYEGSDIDTKLIITPTIEDIIFNRKPVSTTHILENEEHLDAKDIRLYIGTFRKQNFNAGSITETYEFKCMEMIKKLFAVFLKFSCCFVQIVSKHFIAGGRGGKSLRNCFDSYVICVEKVALV